ncbi:putative 15-hydroxyprostaglandin dehydrogenase [Rhexocercosporidium sp. MPI-PUGE-AT-0058]|nr:putative 15-hydroxyprostaglandin dehydrogenase [Rhexocercosporidium sp. MPI-PUGE-AT-0058]
MAHIQINEAHFATLKDKVVVLTGGANGIGRAAVRLFHQHGAKILFGDINTTLGLALESELSSTSAKFISTDVTSYTSQLHLFKTAISLYGKIDVVVANAGVSIPKDPFEFDDVDGDGEEEIEREFPTTEIDVNLKGCLYTTRIGMFYLRRNRNKSLSCHNQNHNQNGVSVGEVVGEGEEGDLILVSSIAGFKESTGLAVYTASKHGVLGLLRGVRVQASREGVRVNAVCPWMTKTAMVAGIETGWRELSLPENEPEDVAESILICATANRRAVLPFAGKVVFVAGGESYEIEDGINELEPRWLGRGIRVFGTW